MYRGHFSKTWEHFSLWPLRNVTRSIGHFKFQRDNPASQKLRNILASDSNNIVNINMHLRTKNKGIASDQLLTMSYIRAQH